MAKPIKAHSKLATVRAGRDFQTSKLNTEFGGVVQACNDLAAGTERIGAQLLDINEHSATIQILIAKHYPKSKKEFSDLVASKRMLFHDIAECMRKQVSPYYKFAKGKIVYWLKQPTIEKLPSLDDLGLDATFAKPIAEKLYGYSKDLLGLRYGFSDLRVHIQTEYDLEVGKLSAWTRIWDALTGVVESMYFLTDALLSIVEKKRKGAMDSFKQVPASLRKGFFHKQQRSDDTKRIVNHIHGHQVELLQVATSLNHVRTNGDAVGQYESQHRAQDALPASRVTDSNSHRAPLTALQEAFENLELHTENSIFCCESDAHPAC
jgi:hypothetical protein